MNKNTTHMAVLSMEGTPIVAVQLSDESRDKQYDQIHEVLSNITDNLRKSDRDSFGIKKDGGHVISQVPSPIKTIIDDDTIIAVGNVSFDGIKDDEPVMLTASIIPLSVTTPNDVDDKKVSAREYYSNNVLIPENRGVPLACILLPNDFKLQKEIIDQQLDKITNLVVGCEMSEFDILDADNTNPLGKLSELMEKLDTHILKDDVYGDTEGVVGYVTLGDAMVSSISIVEGRQLD